MNLPKPTDFKNRLQALAVLDALLTEQWDLRYFSYNSKWGEGEEMASMRDGQGDDYFVLFFNEKIAIKGCSKISKLFGNREYIERIFCEVPVDFNIFLNEPAFSIKDATFVFWYQSAVGWCKVSSDIEDGSSELLGWVMGGAAHHSDWIKNYYGRDIDESDVNYVFNGGVISNDLTARFGFSGDLSCLIADLDEIGVRHTLGDPDSNTT